MSATDYIYPFDPSGSLASNKIISEAIDVSVPSNSTDASFVIFRASPFFANTLVVSTSIGGGTTLMEGVDYILTHQFHAATDALSRPVYGGIQFLNHTYAGRVYASYQSLGGDHTLDSTSIAEELTRDYYSIRTMTWDQLKPQIAGFPPYGHDHTANNLVGLGELIDSTDRIAAAIQDSTSGNTGGGGSDTGTGGTASLTAHINSTQNAHSKSAVQLGNVENFGIASVNDLANSAPNKYVTAGLLRQAFNIYNTDVSSITTRLNVVENAQSEFSEYRTNVNGQFLAINNTFTNYNTIFTDLEENVEAITRTIAINNQTLLEMLYTVTAATDQLQEFTYKLNDFEIDIEALKNIDSVRGAELGAVDKRVTALEERDAQSGYLSSADINPGLANDLYPLEVDHLRDTLDYLMGATHYDLKRINGAYLGQMTANFASTLNGRAYHLDSTEKTLEEAYKYKNYYPLSFSGLEVTTVDGTLPLNHELQLYGMGANGYWYITNRGERTVKLRISGSLQYVRCVSNFDEIGGYNDGIGIAVGVGDGEGEGYRVKTTDVLATPGNPYDGPRKAVVTSIYDTSDVENVLNLATEDDPTLNRIEPEWVAELLAYDSELWLPTIDLPEAINSPNTWHSDWITESAMQGLLVKLPEDCIYFAIHTKRTADALGEEDVVTTIYTMDDAVFRGGGWKYIQLDSWLLDQMDFGFAVSYRTRDVSEVRPIIFLGGHVIDPIINHLTFDTTVSLKSGEFLNFGLTQLYGYDSDSSSKPTIFGVDRYVEVTGGKISAMVDVSSSINKLATLLELAKVEEVPEEEVPIEEPEGEGN